MIAVMGQGCTDAQIEAVQQALESKPGFRAPVWRGEERAVAAAVGGEVAPPVPAESGR